MIHWTDPTAAAISAVAIVVALVGAARSTWSPCGVSMLSTITPLAEKGRGHRWWATATWYLVGSVAGGATLGAALGLLAAGVHALARHPDDRHGHRCRSDHTHGRRRRSRPSSPFRSTIVR